MFLDEIAAKFVADGCGVLDTTLFLGSQAILPTAQDATFATLIETGGTTASRSHNGDPIQKPGAQVAVYAPTYLQARTKALAYYNSLGGADGLHNVTLSGVSYLNIVLRQEPTDTGSDGLGRAAVKFNFDAEKQSS